ncbi:hypothetical protein VTK56DRAFT_6506 [Thermocarpiscus australiensis]
MFWSTELIRARFVRHPSSGRESWVGARFSRKLFDCTLAPLPLEATSNNQIKLFLRCLADSPPVGPLAHILLACRQPTAFSLHQNTHHHG